MSPLIGERCEPSAVGEVDGTILSHMPVCGKFMDVRSKVMVGLENTHTVTSLEEIASDANQRKETRVYMWPAWLIAARERMLEFYSD